MPLFMRWLIRRLFLDFLDHRQFVAARGGEIEFDTVHQCVDEEQTQPTDLAKFERSARVRLGDFFRIEMIAVIADRHDELVAARFADNVDGPIRAPVIGMLDDIRAGFVDCHLDIVDLVFVEAARACRLCDEFGDVAQTLQAAVDSKRIALGELLGDDSLRLAVNGRQTRACAKQNACRITGT